MKRKTIIEAISILLIVLFLYTSVNKLMEFAVFREQLNESPILAQFSSFVVWTLPIAEIIVALMLFIPKWRHKGLYISFIMMIVFTVYVIALVSFSKELPCSCGGILEQLSWRQHILINAVLTVLTGVALSLSKAKAIQVH